MDETRQNEPASRDTAERELFVLDSNIFDKLAAEPGSFVRELRRAVIDTGRIRLFSTHVQADELNRIPDPERREELRSLLTVLTEATLTAGAVYDVSRYDQSTYVDEQDTVISDWMEGNPKHAEDALIANTTRTHGARLVTEDERMIKRASALGVTVWTYDRFRAHVTA